MMAERGPAAHERNAEQRETHDRTQDVHPTHSSVKGCDHFATERVVSVNLGKQFAIFGRQ